MRLGTHAVGRRRYVRRGQPAAGGAAAFLFAVGLLAAPALEAQGTQAGTQFSNWATLSFTSGGTGYAVASDTVAILVGQVAGVSRLGWRGMGRERGCGLGVPGCSGGGSLGVGARWGPSWAGAPPGGAQGGGGRPQSRCPGRAVSPPP